MKQEQGGQPLICGIQQVGIGVSDVAEAFAWYKANLGTDAVIFDEKAPAEYMLPYTGGEPRPRHAVLAMNLQGGGGFEIWQHTGFAPRGPEFDPMPGDYGVYACKIKCRSALKAHKFHMDRKVPVSALYKDALGRDYYYLTDPYGNRFQVVEVTDEKAWFCNEDKPTGGVYGGLVGTHDMDAAIAFYRDMLDYDLLHSDTTDTFADLSALGTPGVRFRRVLLGQSRPRQGNFSALLGTSEIELIQALDRPTPCRKIFENRMWGELGFIQICYDIRRMDALRDKAVALNRPFTVDSMKQNPNFGMGDAAGHFAYNEDPSGTLIEYVETCRIPILKKYGIFLNVGKRPAEKALPRWVVSCLRFLKK